MSPEETVSRSSLDKPLHLLTDDDISQLTREDCRRYLKEKGMRRPSWNKSQAVQQVILLKALLETPSDSDAIEARKKLYIPRPEIPHRLPSDSAVSAKGTSADARISVSPQELVPYRRQDLSKPDVSWDISGRLATADKDSVSPRTAGATIEPVGQMTILYCGKVNVYDDVPSDKAKALMHLAASPTYLHEEAPSNVDTKLWQFPCQLQVSGVDVSPDFPVAVCPTQQTGGVAEYCRLPREESNISLEDNSEGPTSRKASVQRYLEKRKDRLTKLDQVIDDAKAALAVLESAKKVGLQNILVEGDAGLVTSPLNDWEKYPQIGSGKM